MAGAAFVTDLTEVLTQATEAAAGIAGLMNGFDILKISRKYYELYDEQRDFYYSTFQNGVERPLILEVTAMAPYTLNYAGQVANLYGALGPFGGQSGDADGWWSRHAGMYNTVKNPSITELDPDLARLKSDWTNYLFRFEEHWYDTRNDIRWTRRLILHNIGIKQGSAVSATLATAFANFQNEMEDTGAQLATLGNGAARFAGYRRGLGDVADTFGAQELPGNQTKTYLLGPQTTDRNGNKYSAKTFGRPEPEESFFEVLP